MNRNTLPPSPYVPEHWDLLAALPYQPAGPVGVAPARWAERLKLEDVPDAYLLPTDPLDRDTVRDLCRDPARPVLFGYLCAMAWGGQGVGPTRRHAITAWMARDRLVPILEKLRHEPLGRADAYALFLDGPRILGLGPSYWTKIQYFFGGAGDHYVMDQWVAKSVNLLAGREIVPLAGDCPARDNPAAVYEAYCAEIDRIATLLGLTGAQAEEKMMSRGGRRPGDWRRHVRGRSLWGSTT